jgi:hypothetical protein
VPESDAVCLELTEEESRTPIREVAARRTPGKAYFLEVFVAREVLDAWMAMRGVKQLDPAEATRVVVQTMPSMLLRDHRVRAGGYRFSAFRGFRPRVRWHVACSSESECLIACAFLGWSLRLQSSRGVSR